MIIYLLILIIIVIIIISMARTGGIEYIYPINYFKYIMQYDMPKNNPFKEPIDAIYKRVVAGDFTVPDLTYKSPFIGSSYNNFYVSYVLSHFITVIKFLKEVPKTARIIYISTLTDNIVPNILTDWYEYDIYLFNHKPDIYYTSVKIKFFNRFPTAEDYKKFQGAYLINTTAVIGPIGNAFYKNNSAVFGIEYNNILLREFKPIKALSFLSGVPQTCLISMPDVPVNYIPFSYGSGRGLYTIITEHPVRFKTIDLSRITDKVIAFNYFVRNYKDTTDMEIYNRLDDFTKKIINKYLCNFDKKPNKKLAKPIQYTEEYIMINPTFFNRVFDRYYYLRKGITDHNIRYNKFKPLVPHFKNRDYNNPVPKIEKDILIEPMLLTFRRALNEIYTVYKFDFSKMKLPCKNFLRSRYTRSYNESIIPFYIDDDFDNFAIIKIAYSKLKVYKDMFALYDYMVIPPIKGLEFLMRILVPEAGIITTSKYEKDKEKKYLVWKL